MRIVVTGATGFIGSYLVKELLSQGHDLLCTKRSTSNLYRLEGIENKVLWVDLTKGWQNDFLYFKPNAVFNLGWDGVSSKERVLWNKQIANIQFQQNLLELSQECGVEKFIGIGSQSEYGDFEGIVNEDFPVNPQTAYAATKLACLDLLRTFCMINGMEWYWFRLFPLFGPYESDNWLIPSLIKNIYSENNMDLTLGEQRLSYLYVGECVKAIASPLYSPNHSGVYNICGDNMQTLRSLVTKIRDMINPNFRLNFGALPYRYGQSMFMGGNTELLSKYLYKLDTSSFEEKLKETILYYKYIYGRTN